MTMNFRPIRSTLLVLVVLFLIAFTTMPTQSKPKAGTFDCCSRACAGLQGEEYQACYNACIHEKTGGGPCRR